MKMNNKFWLRLLYTAIMKMNKKFWLRLLRDLIIFVVILIAVHFYQTRHVPDITPELKTTLISGESFDLSKITQPTLLYFWGSWCPTCSFTSSVINELAKEYPVVTIAYSSGNHEEVKQYLQENQLNFKVINDEFGEISQNWRVKATPMFFIINAKGEVSSVTVGITSSWGLQIRFWLAF